MFNPIDQIRLQQRRTFLSRIGRGTGAMALASLLNPSLLFGGQTSGPHYEGTVLPRDFKPKAKRVIWLGMAGGPSHLETFDYKPVLGEMAGKPMPESFTDNRTTPSSASRPTNTFSDFECLATFRNDSWAM